MKTLEEQLQEFITMSYGNDETPPTPEEIETVRAIFFTGAGTVLANLNDANTFIGLIEASHRLREEIIAWGVARRATDPRKAGSK